jgi:predicted nucleotidyltransferase component of viral defense system
MIDFDLGKYINYVKSKLDISIEDQYIEKDYLLSLFLSTWQNLREGGDVKSLDELIFKGGTLLTRNHLKYPRISEDLDFTHKKSKEIRIMSQNERIKTIRKLISQIIKDIKKICNSCEFDFKTDRSNTNYITAYHHKAVYSLCIYKKSEITNLTIHIKIEINFVENLQHYPVVQTIQPIISNDAVLTSLGYNLSPLKISCYALEEIVLEKYRALLTRDNLKERDVFDLYLINKMLQDVLKFDNKKIIKKIKDGYITSNTSEENLEKNCKLINEKSFGVYNDNISSLTLVKIDNVDYEKFKNLIFDKLKNICNEII